MCVISCTILASFLEEQFFSCHGVFAECSMLHGVTYAGCCKFACAVCQLYLLHPQVCRVEAFTTLYHQAMVTPLLECTHIGPLQLQKQARQQHMLEQLLAAAKAMRCILGRQVQVCEPMYARPTIARSDLDLR